MPPLTELQVRDQFQATALMLCAERGHTEMVDSLLSAGADAGCVDENGNSALHLASFYGRTDVVEVLLSVDVDVTVRGPPLLMSKLVDILCPCCRR